jgi:hypothetical protein
MVIRLVLLCPNHDDPPASFHPTPYFDPYGQLHYERLVTRAYPGVPRIGDHVLLFDDDDDDTSYAVVAVTWGNDGPVTLTMEVPYASWGDMEQFEVAGYTTGRAGFPGSTA